MLNRYRPGTRWDCMAEFAPSVGWIGLMLLPLVFQYADLHATGRALQLGIVCAIAVLLVASDCLGFALARRRPLILGHCLVNRWLILLGLCFLLPAAAHLYLMPRIPLLALYTDKDATETSMTLLRLDAGKLMAVPSAVMYLFNWALVVFAPVFVVSAWFTGRRRPAIYGLLVASMYAIATWAKLPVALLLVTCAFTGCVMPGPLRRGLCLGGAGLVLLVFIALGVLFASGSLTHLKSAASHAQSPVLLAMQPDDPRRALTYGDNFRFESVVPDVERSSFRRVLEYVVYRAWLTPADVSSRWYQYYTYVQKEPLGIFSLVGTSDGVAPQTPSRVVGIWAYQARFPYKYWNTVSAYASFDADAFARGGMLGVVLATLLFMVTRIVASCLVTSHPVGLAAYAVLLCVLAILPSFASIQAIFGANGLMVVLALLMVIRLSTPSGIPATKPVS